MGTTDWGAVYERQVGFVQFILSRCGVFPPEADDLVQEVFMRLMKGDATFESERQLQAWLATTARRLVIDGVRRRKRRPEDSHDDAQLADERASPDAVVDALAFEKVLKVIDAEDEGRLLRKFYLEDKPVKEIAAELRAPVGTITARLTRLRARLREVLRT